MYTHSHVLQHTGSLLYCRLYGTGLHIIYIHIIFTYYLYIHLYLQSHIYFLIYYSILFTQVCHSNLIRASLAGDNQYTRGAGTLAACASNCCKPVHVDRTDHFRNLTRHTPPFAREQIFSSQRLLLQAELFKFVN